MKKILLLAVFILGLGPVSFAQSNAVKLNVPSLFVATLSGAYERQLTEATSLQLGGFGTRLNIFSVDFSGYGITPEFRYYPGGEALNGFFVGPYLRYQQLTAAKEVNGTPSSIRLTTYGGGLVGGYHAHLGQTVSLEPYLGLGYNSPSVSIRSGTAASSDYNLSVFSGFAFRPGLALGVRF